MSTLPQAPDSPPAEPSAGLSDAERALRVLQGVEPAFWERELHTDIAWLSPRFKQLMGLPAHAQRQEVWARIHPDDLGDFSATYEAARNCVGPFSNELRALNAHGEYRWLRLEGRFLPDTQGSAVRVVGMAQDIHAEYEARQGLEALTERMNRAIEALSEAVVDGSAEPGDFFISANLTRMLGYPEGTPVPDAHTYLSWVHPEDIDALRREIRLGLQQPRHWNVTYRLRHADGQYRWMRARGQSRQTASGQLRSVGMVGDIHDFTLAQQELASHREHLEQLVAERTASLDAALAAAQQARLQAESADRAKSAFLAHMSHEIRTPLNGLLGLTELALSSAVNPSQRRYLEVALQSGHALLGVINDVLEMSRLEAGEPHLAHEPFDVAEVLAAALRSTAPLLGQRPVRVRFDVEGDPTWLRGDANRLRQIAINLLGNAAKFTEHGHISLSARLQPTQDGRVALDMTVSDTGPGMSPEVAAHVFDAFYQGDSSLSRRHGGSGLGLSIARGQARALGGELSVSSTPGQGSVFSFQAVFQPAHLTHDAEDMAPLPAGTAWLLVADPEDAQWLQRRLQRLGWQVEVAPDLDAVERLAAAGRRPDLLLSTPALALPEGQKWSRLRRALPDVPVHLMIRANWSDLEREREAQAQAMALTVTPMTPAVLRRLLRDSRQGQHAVRAAHPLAGRSVLLVEDNPVNQVIGQRMLEHMGMGVRSAHDGAQALAACLATAPDLVIMDVRMPVMDGLEATRRLRSLQREGRLPAFPVLGLSAHALDTDRQAALEAGMDDYVTKPIDTERLRQALQRWVRPGTAAV
jgi:PAS domain S-box-containing protein